MKCLTYTKLLPSLSLCSKNNFNNNVVFTKNNQFVVAAIRKSIHVWDTQTGNHIKALDSHFGRILSLVPVTVGDKLSKLVSSSIDRSIKVSDCRCQNFSVDLFPTYCLNHLLPAARSHFQICPNKEHLNSSMQVEFIKIFVESTSFDQTRMILS